VPNQHEDVLCIVSSSLETEFEPIIKAPDLHKYPSLTSIIGFRVA